MRSYLLESVEHQGRRYSPCSAIIDEDSNEVEFLRSKGLGRKELVGIGKLSIDASTEIRLSGRAIKAGPWAIVASSEADAAEIAKLLLKPKEARAMLEGEMLELEKSVSAFLKLREEGVQLLVGFLADPRRTSFSLSSSWNGPTASPVEEFLANLATRLSAALLDVSSAAAALAGKVSDQIVEDVYAFTYATAILQSSVLAGGEGRAAAEEMLGELGIRLPSGGRVDPPAASARLVQLAHPILFSVEPSSPLKSRPPSDTLRPS